MPYSSMEGVPAQMKKIHGTPLTLSQINLMARIADGLIAKGMDEGRAWSIAKGNFQNWYTIKDGRWIRKKKEMSLDFSDLQGLP